MAIVKAPTGATTTTITASASANVKGSWVQLVASTANAIKGMWISFFPSANTNARSSVDIGTGAASSETVVIADIHWANTSNDRPGVWFCYVPISIAAGTRIAARLACSTGSTAHTMAIWMVEGTGGGTTTTYGITTNQSVSVDPGAVANTPGAWAEITASSSADMAWMIVQIDTNNNVPASSSAEIHIGTGGSGSEVVQVQRLAFHGDGSYGGLQPSVFGFPISIPSGTRIVARSTSTSNHATGRLLRVSIIGCSAVVS